MANPQDIAEDLIELAEDKSRIVFGLAQMSEQNRALIKSAIEFIKKNTNPTSKNASKKPKVTKSSRPSDEEIINELKLNLKKYSVRGIISFIQIEADEFERIRSLNIDQNESDFRSFHSRILSDRSKINVMILYQDCCEGWLYDIVRSAIEAQAKTDADFIQYCKRVFNVSENTIDTYLSFYYLVQDFPSILLSNLCVTKINRYSNLIKKTVETDNELKELLEKPFCGIEGSFAINKLFYTENN
jgi:hypothetical protein